MDKFISKLMVVVHVIIGIYAALEYSPWAIMNFSYVAYWIAIQKGSGNGQDLDEWEVDNIGKFRR